MAVGEREEASAIIRRAHSSLRRRYDRRAFHSFRGSTSPTSSRRRFGSTSVSATVSFIVRRLRTASSWYCRVASAFHASSSSVSSRSTFAGIPATSVRSEEHTSALHSHLHLLFPL